MADIQNTKLNKMENVVLQANPWWIPPPAGLMKINVDATLSKSSGVASSAAVARDVEGNFLSIVVLSGLTDPETM
jgi:hypothetical protein